MSYLVFARKYRPQSFTDILGQDPIVTTLSNAIQSKRIGQAYLFAGPRGTGKTSAARIFAKSLNCEKGPTVKPCLKCAACEEIAQGRSLDVLEIDGASNRGIDQIRALRELAKFTPAVGIHKVYIIDEVHQITAEGFNALLKILEEPPAHLLFILATTAAHKVPATILSRCQKYDFKRLPQNLIIEKLNTVAKQEKLQLAKEAAIGIARAASGSLRDAESILDQAVAFTKGKIKAADVQLLLGTLDQDVFVKTAEGIHARDPVALLKIIAEATDSGVDLIQWATGFLAFLRNLLVAKVGAGPLGFEDLDQEEIARVQKLSENFSVDDLTGIAQLISAAVDQMRRVHEPRIPLEVVLVRISSNEPTSSIGELVDRLEALGGSVSPGRNQSQTAPSAARALPKPPQLSRSVGEPTVAPKKTSQAKTESPKATSAKSASASNSLNQIRSVWADFLDQLHAQKASVAAYLAEAAPIGVEGKDPLLVVIGFPKGFEFHLRALDNRDSTQVISKLLAELSGLNAGVLLKQVESLPEDALIPLPQKASPAALASDSVPESETPEPEGAPPDKGWVRSVADMFEGRVMPGKETS